MASKRPRQPRHHRIDAACGHNFCYPAHRIIPMEGQNHLCEMQRYVANVAITPSTFRKLGAGFVEAAQDFLASLNLQQLSESRTLGLSEVVGGSNASAHGEGSYSRTLGASQKIDQHLHGDGFAEPISVRRVQAAPLWLCARSATGQYCHKEVACVGKGEKSCAPR